VFATKSLLELGGGECGNLNFMNFKTDSIKIREFQELLKFVKFDFSIYGLHTTQVLVIASGKLPASTKPQDLHWIHNGRENARYLHRLSVMDPAAARFRLNSYYKFVIVRHPFDRLVSAFREKFSGNKEQYRQLEKRIIRRSAE